MRKGAEGYVEIVFDVTLDALANYKKESVKKNR